MTQGERWVSASRLARTLTLVRWPQMGALPHVILGPSCTTASSRPGSSDRRVLEERGNTFSHAHKVETTARLPASSLQSGLLSENAESFGNHSLSAKRTKKWFRPWEDKSKDGVDWYPQAPSCRVTRRLGSFSWGFTYV